MGNKTYGGRWRTVRPLGEGGQAWTYVVEDASSSGTNQYVLKRLKNKKRLDRFESEIRAVQNLSHPNIIRIVDHDVLDDEPYFVMEYCDFGDLEHADLHTKSVSDKLSLFREICSGIGSAHEKKIIHRDIKPANILFRQSGQPVVSDFGICFVTDEGFERMTETVEQMGARYYIAPELADGRADTVTPSSDVYSLGKLLYWLFAGRVMNRENFDDTSFDLRNASDPNHAIYHVYELLKQSVTASPEDRFLDANGFAFEVGKVLNTIDQNGHFLDKNLQHRCVFCGSGRYKVTDTPYEASGQLNYDNARALGLNPLDHQTGAGNVNALRLRILECEWCGNVQLFRTNNKHWKN